MRPVRSLLAILFLVGLSTQAPAQPAIGEPIARRIDTLFAAHDRDGSPGYAVGIVRDGALVFARGYGRADLDHNIPITPRTAFHTASLSKQFTAACVALLILDGKLTIDTPVAKYFPALKAHGADLRIKHLIYFTSGLRDYTSLPRSNGLPWFSFHYFTVDEAIATTLAAKDLEFPPGTRWAYSNVNYMMLTKIVERESGMPFSAFLEKRIFGPLEMRASHVNDDATAIVTARATGYADRSDAAIREQLKSVGIHVRPGSGYVRLPRVSPHYGGSGVFSSIEDLAKWDANFYSNRLAGPAFAAQMHHREKFAHDKDNDAFGLVFGRFRGRPMIWFAGGDLDSSTYMARLPEERLTVICLSNIPTGNADRKAREILEVLLDAQTSTR